MKHILLKIKYCVECGDMFKTLVRNQKTCTTGCRKARLKKQQKRNDAKRYKRLNKS